LDPLNYSFGAASDGRAARSGLPARAELGLTKDVTVSDFEGGRIFCST